MSTITLSDAERMELIRRANSRAELIEGLALALLVDAQNQRIIGRVQLEPNNISDLLEEERIGRELEALAAMRLQSEETHVAMHHGAGDPGLRRERAPRQGGRQALRTSHRLELRSILRTDPQRLGRSSHVRALRSIRIPLGQPGTGC